MHGKVNKYEVTR